MSSRKLRRVRGVRPEIVERLAKHKIVTCKVKNLSLLISTKKELFKKVAGLWLFLKRREHLVYGLFCVLQSDCIMMMMMMMMMMTMMIMMMMMMVVVVAVAVVMTTMTIKMMILTIGYE